MPDSKLEEKFYVPCRVARGMFSSEYLVELMDFDGDKKVGFVDKSSVKIEREPKGSGYIDGLLKVISICKSGFKALIQLPTEMQERVYVQAGKLETFV